MRKMSAKRAARLREAGTYDASSTFARSPLRLRRRARGISPRVRAAVLARDGYACVRCGISLRLGMDPYSIHHRKQRSLGGDNSLPNLITLCGTGTTGCHGIVHELRHTDHMAGYWIQSWEDPRSSVVIYSFRLHGGANDAWWYLHSDRSLGEGPEQ